MSEHRSYELDLLKEKTKRQSRSNLLKFTGYTMPSFEAAPFHKVYYDVLNRFSKGQIKKLMITMPPQHGKSEGSTRRLPAHIFGTDPDTKVVVSSYSGSFARDFNRDIQRIIDDESYNGLYPETYLNASNVVTVSSNYLRNSDKFEIVGHKGSLKAVGRGGPLTGSAVDVMIMDDLYKDYAEGNSPTIRDAVWQWYLTVVKTRLHNGSQELIVFTRWHEDDLIGRLEKSGEEVVTITSLDQIKDIPKRAWVKINFEAIMTGEPTDIDPRKKGEPLWPNKHSLEKLKEVRDLNPELFNCLYQGDPQSSEGLLYRPFKTYTNLPDCKITKNYTDTADTGADYLCSIVYKKALAVSDNHLYITDVLYTTQGMEETEPATISLLNRNEVNQADVESNNGGRGFARVVNDSVRAEVNWFHQSKNKESRIYSESASVNNVIVFPIDWHTRWPQFYDDVTKYKKIFKANKHDDGPDVLTGIVEMNRDSNHIGIIW